MYAWRKKKRKKKREYLPVIDWSRCSKVLNWNRSLGTMMSSNEKFIESLSTKTRQHKRRQTILSMQNISRFYWELDDVSQTFFWGNIKAVLSRNDVLKFATTQLSSCKREEIVKQCKISDMLFEFEKSRWSGLLQIERV